MGLQLSMKKRHGGHFTMRKSDGVRVQFSMRKSDRVRVHHEKE